MMNNWSAKLISCGMKQQDPKGDQRSTAHRCMLGKRRDRETSQGSCAAISRAAVRWAGRFGKARPSQTTNHMMRMWRCCESSDWTDCAGVNDGAGAFTAAQHLCRTYDATRKLAVDDRQASYLHVMDKCRTNILRIMGEFELFLTLINMKQRLWSHHLSLLADWKERVSCQPANKT